jgi:hypothetical protein
MKSSFQLVFGREKDIGLQAARRRYLHLACVHFARELALNDGFSRLNSSELAAALRWSLDEFRSV